MTYPEVILWHKVKYIHNTLRQTYNIWLLDHSNTFSEDKEVVFWTRPYWPWIWSTYENLPQFVRSVWGRQRSNTSRLSELFINFYSYLFYNPYNTSYQLYLIFSFIISKLNLSSYHSFRPFNPFIFSLVLFSDSITVFHFIIFIKNRKSNRKNLSFISDTYKHINFFLLVTYIETPYLFIMVYFISNTSIR